MSGMTLQRFLDAQQGVYDRALEELRAGRKRTHWMWFVFPQIAGLGRSELATFYALEGLDEARAYLEHPVLGRRLRDCTEAVLPWAGTLSFESIFGPIDALKFASSMTLFEAAGGPPCFAQALESLCGGERDQRTLALARIAH